MTAIFLEAFAHYGTGAVGIGHMLDGTWADAPTPLVFCTINTPSWDSSGEPAFFNSVDGSGARYALKTPLLPILMQCHFGLDALPQRNNSAKIFQWRNSGNSTLFYLTVQSTGTVEFRTGADVLLAATQSPVIVAENFHLIETKLDITGQTFELRVDQNVVIAASGLATGATAVAQITICGGGGGGLQDTAALWMKDLIICDTNGSVNNDFNGDLRVAALFPNADGADQGWTPQYRHKFGNGILDIHSVADSCIGCPNSASTDLGAGDWTLEGYFRIANLPTGSNKGQIIGKWDETNNRRSYQLYIGGPALESGNIVFRTSTNGTAGTVTESISYPWIPDTDTWYHIAVVRASGELLLFIDGIQLGLPIADATTYYAGIEPLSVGAQVEGAGGVVNNTHLDGWVDELRVTVGFARYTSNFSPAGPWPRGGGSDPEWADVVLLCGFDSGLNDESSFARAVISLNGGAAYTPDDGFAAYQSIYHHVPQDDTFVEAALLQAGSTLTLSAQPANNDTVTVGHYTNAGSHAAVYKFKTALASAFDVLIGANVAATLFNLRSAINLAAGSGTLYGTSTIVNDDVTAQGLPGSQMAVTADIAGTAGNAIASTSSLTHGGGWTGTTLSGGANIPGTSSFFFDRPPLNTTIIKAVQIINRSFKTDSGDGSEQITFVGPLGGTEAGANNPLTITPVYRWDIFETDPDTSSNITPSTIVGGSVRINRTA